MFSQPAEDTWNTLTVSLVMAIVLKTEFLAMTIKCI